MESHKTEVAGITAVNDVERIVPHHFLDLSHKPDRMDRIRGFFPLFELRVDKGIGGLPEIGQPAAVIQLFHIRKNLVEDRGHISQQSCI